MGDDNQTSGLSHSLDGDAARQKMQVKSFTAWVNLHLKTTGLKVDDLKTDFQDGIKLLRLVEIISEDELGKFNQNPVSKFQKVENLNIPLKYINSFLHEVGIRNTYCARLTSPLHRSPPLFHSSLVSSLAPPLRHPLIASVWLC